MISLHTIAELSQKLQTTSMNILREYVQHQFLSYFYQQPQTDKIFFKGGTALRIVYQSPRFSEDLDFSASGRQNTRGIEEALLQTVKEMEREAIAVRVKESKETSGGYLAILVCTLFDQDVTIQLEVSQRVGNIRGDVATIVNNFIPPYTLMTMTRQQLVAEKCKALMTRGKARDYYDLYFILRANLLPAGEKHMLRAVATNVHATQLNFEKELGQFLPSSHRSVIRNFKHVLEAEIQRSLGV
ncbi:nucleotidyl transferase AbiEii/AbiGii toxin family protein [Candidatus Gottesmanbacteria bacterium]|nr:nucleotidyl transferase AbiEii/AbiGii toxin family protein [Candidatus Gottesmanbacteria bacterium]